MTKGRSTLILREVFIPQNCPLVCLEEMATTKYFPCTASFFLVSLARLGMVPQRSPRGLHVHTGFSSGSPGALYCLFPAQLNAIPHAAASASQSLAWRRVGASGQDLLTAGRQRRGRKRQLSSFYLALEIFLSSKTTGRWSTYSQAITTPTRTHSPLSAPKHPQLAPG